jgi:hypothetical protein
MIRKVFTAIIVIVAVVVGILNIFPVHPDLVHMNTLALFFSASLPVLAFGALVKYLCTCGPCKCCVGMGCKCCGDDKMCPTDLRDRRPLV